MSPGTNFFTNTQSRLNPAVKLFHATGAQLNVVGKECANHMIVIYLVIFVYFILFYF